VRTSPFQPQRNWSTERLGRAATRLSVPRSPVARSSNRSAADRERSKSSLQRRHSLRWDASPTFGAVVPNRHSGKRIGSLTG